MHLVVLLSLASLLSGAHATDQTTNFPPFATFYSTTNFGKKEVQKSQGYPSAYWVVTSNSVNYALEVTLSKLGLSLSPKDLTPAKFIERFQHTNNLFWTDYFELNQAMLQRLRCTLATLALSPDEGVRYRAQIVGSWHIDPDFDPVRQGFGQRRVKFMLAAIIEKKAIKSAYVPVREIYNPAPIFERFITSMESELADCPNQRRELAPTVFPPGFDPGPSIGEPPTRKRSFQ